MKKTAIVTGITGQDGAYLAELLLKKGYRVVGTFRRASSVNFWRITELGIRHHEDLVLAEFDLTDSGACISLVDSYKPDEIYNLAAQSFVGVSFEQPVTTTAITGVGVLNLLEAIRITRSKARFYQASTSELFGKVQTVPQSEATPFYPRSPYAVAKLYGHWMTVNYRESYGIFGSSGILFNHESPLRGQEFVTRKISDSVAKIKLGLAQSLELGNLEAQRDWGYAKEYVEGMWRMLQVDEPDTFVLSTGRTETVRSFLVWAFAAADMEIVFEGQGADEVAVDRKSGRVVTKINRKHYRPAEVDLLIGDASLAERKLGWKATTDVETLCRMMVEKDLARNAKGDTY